MLNENLVDLSLSYLDDDDGEHDDDRDEDHQGPDNFDETDTNIDDISSS